MRGFAGTAVLVFCALSSTAADAQQPTDQDAMAVAQFERGLAAMNEGNYALGCPALTESVRIDPRAGAIFTLAECESRWGHVASADAHYADYLARFGRMTVDQQRLQRGRDTIAGQKRNELRAQIPQLSLRLPEATTGAVVKRDGIVLGAPSLGVYLPVDPGPHVIAIEMPDGGKSEQTVSVELASRREVVLTLPPPVVHRAAPGAGDAAVTPGRPWLAYGALTIGAAGVAVGIVEGLDALSKKSTIDDHCVGVVCDHDGKVAADSARQAAVISTVGFAVGAAGVVAGIVVLLTRGSASRGTARTIPLFVFDPRRATVGAGGTF